MELGVLIVIDRGVAAPKFHRGSCANRLIATPGAWHKHRCTRDARLSCGKTQDSECSMLAAADDRGYNDRSAIRDRLSRRTPRTWISPGPLPDNVLQNLQPTRPPVIPSEVEESLTSSPRIQRSLDVAIHATVGSRIFLSS